MAEIVKMPRLSDTMEEGVVAKWHKNVGDQVSEGDLLAEIETDKATMEFESFQEGTLLHIGVGEGDAAPVDSILAILGEKGEDVAALIAADAAGGDAAPAEEAPAPAAEEAPAPAPAAEAAPAPAPAPAPAAAPAPAPVATASDDGRLKASPLARKMAEDRGIDLGRVQGSGDGGRIVKRDVDGFNPALAPTPQAAPAAVTPSAHLEESYTEERVSQMRKTIARRLTDSKFTAPHFYLTVEIDMDNAIASRKQINELPDTKVSFNDMVIKAVAMSLRKHPAVNSAWMGDTIRRNNHVHIGVAVAVDEGLLVPVVRFADSKSFTQIGAEVRELAGKARDKKLQPSEWEGNTFTISNLGMFGIDEFTAIVNPPDSCILAIGGISQKPVVKNGEIVPGNIMKVTMSCDHRVVDGATGAQFLQTFKQYMEQPVAMLA